MCVLACHDTEFHESIAAFSRKKLVYKCTIYRMILSVEVLGKLFICMTPIHPPAVIGIWRNQKCVTFIKPLQSWILLRLIRLYISEFQYQYQYQYREIIAKLWSHPLAQWLEVWPCVREVQGSKLTLPEWPPHMKNIMNSIFFTFMIWNLSSVYLQPV